MKLPKIDLTSLPDLADLTAMFGSRLLPGDDDRIIVIASVVYESSPPGNGMT